MTSSPVLDVALGLSFVYFLFGVIATAATESISRLMKQRPMMLEKWIGGVLSNPDTGAEATDIVDEFFKTPIMRVLHISTGGDAKRPSASKKLGLPSPRSPSYIPSTQFIAAVLHTGRETRDAAPTSKSVWHAIGYDLQRLKGTPAGDALLDLYGNAGGDAARFRKHAEAWFDEQMEHLSGAYKRWSQSRVLVIGLVVVVALNANTLRMAETLWNDPDARGTLASQAPLPLGWDHTGYSTVWGWVLAIFGALITLLAISRGAPFWFDAFCRFGQLRKGETPPPASGHNASV